MCVQPINSISSHGHLFCTNGFNINSVKSAEAIKKIATDQDLNIFITKAKVTSENRYIIMVMAYKEHWLKKGVASSFIDINKKAEELSVRIFNTAIKAIESLQDKTK
jgi:hypothetical protein